MTEMEFSTTTGSAAVAQTAAAQPIVQAAQAVAGVSQAQVRFGLSSHPLLETVVLYCSIYTFIRL